MCNLLWGDRLFGEPENVMRFDSCEDIGQSQRSVGETIRCLLHSNLYIVVCCIV